MLTLAQETERDSGTGDTRCTIGRGVCVICPRDRYRTMTRALDPVVEWQQR
jgi:hypothetical protein